MPDRRTRPFRSCSAGMPRRVRTPGYTANMQSMLDAATRINAQFKRYGLAYDVVRVDEDWTGEPHMLLIRHGDAAAMHNLAITLEMMCDAFIAMHPEQGGQLRLF